MKKNLFSILSLAVLLLLAISSVAFAADRLILSVDRAKLQASAAGWVP